MTDEPIVDEDSEDAKIPWAYADALEYDGTTNEYWKEDPEDEVDFPGYVHPCKDDMEEENDVYLNHTKLVRTR